MLSNSTDPPRAYCSLRQRMNHALCGMAAEGILSVSMLCAADSVVFRERRLGLVPYLLALVHFGGNIYANWLFRSKHPCPSSCLKPNITSSLSSCLWPNITREANHHCLPNMPMTLPMGCEAGPGPRPASWKHLETAQDG